MPNEPSPASDLRLVHLRSLLKDRYAFQSVIGRSDEGTVFEVMNLRLGRAEVMKVLPEEPDAELARRFTLGVKASSLLDHPHIAKVFDVGQGEGVRWIAAQFVDGPTMLDILQMVGPVEESVAARAAVPVLEALAYGHSRGLVHGDIRLSNIIVDERGQPFLTDFGVAVPAKIAGATANGGGDTGSGGGVDPRGDLFALGHALYILISGEPPFQDGGGGPDSDPAARENPKPLHVRRPDMHPAIAAVIMRALAKRDSGYAAAAEMREALIGACEVAGVRWKGPLADLPLVPANREPLSSAADPGRKLDRSQAAQGGRQAQGPDGEASAARTSRRKRLSVAGALAGVILVVVGGLLLSWRACHRPGGEEALSGTAGRRTSETGRPGRAALPGPGRPEKPGTPFPPTGPPAVSPRLLETVEAEPELGCAGSKVTLSLVVSAYGTVKEARVLSAPRPACGNAARTAALKYRYSPARDADGYPMDSPPITVEVQLPAGP